MLNEWHDGVIKDLIGSHWSQHADAQMRATPVEPGRRGGVRSVSRTGDEQSRWRVARWSIPPSPISPSGVAGPAAVLLIGVPEGEGRDFQLTWEGSRSHYSEEEVTALLDALDKIGMGFRIVNRDAESLSGPH